MQKDIDRDESVAQLLRHTLRGQPSEPGSCVDGEVLATWSDGALPAPQATVVETHLGGCARCQALLAAFVRSAPAEPEPVPALWKRWRLQWAAPIAAAAALTLWIALPDDQRPTAPESVQARADVPAAPVLLEAPAATSPPPQQEETRLENGAAGTQAPPAAADLDALVDSAAAEPARPAEALGRLSAEQDQAVLESSDVATSSNANEPAQSGARAQTDEAPARLRSTAEEAELASPQPAAASAQAERRQAVAQQVAAPIEIRSPDSARRWRILPGGTIERTTTAGTAWEPVEIAPPATIVAGSSPSASVCWLVGPGGAVRVTTDGVRFDQVPFPEPVNLVGVRATDAESAVVIAADGTEFQTTDRGGSWARANR